MLLPHAKDQLGADNHGKLLLKKILFLIQFQLATLSNAKKKQLH